MHLPITEYKKNQGIVLFLCLVFLLVSTLLGVSSLRGNLFTEKMTSNTIQRVKATEAAEFALLEGEQFVQNSYRTIIANIFNSSGLPTLQASDCTTNINGQGGICVPIEHSSNPALINFQDHWQDLRGANATTSLNVWSTQARHRLSNPLIQNKYNLNTPPKYIIEFLGYTPSQSVTACTPEIVVWPYCNLDQALFRVTALATAGNDDETRIMLQSTYLVN